MAETLLLEQNAQSQTKGWVESNGEEWKNGQAIGSPEMWAKLKVLSIRGVPDADLSERYGVSPEAIRGRRFRDPLWKAAMKIPQIENGSPKQGITQTDCKEVETAISDSLQANGEQSSLIASQIALGALQKALAAPESIRLASIGDVNVAMKTARTAAGMDKAQLQTSVSLFAGPSRSSPTQSAWLSVDQTLNLPPDADIIDLDE